MTLLILLALAVPGLAPRASGDPANHHDGEAPPRASRREADGGAAALATVAERSGFRATARHAEVVQLLDRLADTSPLVRRVSLGRSGEDRDIAAVVIADPPVATPADAAAARAAGKLVVMAIGNIHGGEVCGKEALPMLARLLIDDADAQGGGDPRRQRHEAGTIEGRPQTDPPIGTTAPAGGGQATAPRELLRDLVIILAPIYNADGNERFDVDNRRGQVGPEEGMGERANAGGLDLNRDFIKLDAPETRALVAFLSEWDPHVFIDTHTTNGSLHRYLITYDGPKTPAGDPRLIEFTRDRMFPAITKLAMERYGIPTFFYGNFEQDHTRWTTYPAEARYGTSYVGLRGRISILSEAYAYAGYKERVLGTRDFVLACLEYAVANRQPIRDLLEQIDADAIAGKPRAEEERIAIRSEASPAPRKFDVAGFEEAPAEKAGADGFELRHIYGHPLAVGKPKTYSLDLWNHYKPTLSVRRPFAYVLPADLTAVIEKLEQHGIEMRRLAQDAELEVEVYTVTSVEHRERAFEQHRLATVEVQSKVQQRRVAPNAVIVPTAQRLGRLAVYLLEPHCEDGLATWNYFDEWLKPGEEFPVLRVPQSEALPP